jgi:hypothetical protein
MAKEAVKERRQKQQVCCFLEDDSWMEGESFLGEKDPESPGDVVFSRLLFPQMRQLITCSSNVSLRVYNLANHTSCGKSSFTP